jgi:hypothetical protein
MTRERVCLLYMLMNFASVVFLGSESLGIRDHILLSQFETTLFVASYDSQGRCGGIRSRLHTGLLGYSGTFYISSARTTQKAPSSVVRIIV